MLKETILNIRLMFIQSTRQFLDGMSDVLLSAQAFLQKDLIMCLTSEMVLEGKAFPGVCR